MSVTKKQAIEALKHLNEYVNGASADEAVKVTIPSPKEVSKMKSVALDALAESLGIVEVDDLKAVLTTIANVAADEEVDADDLSSALTALELTPGKKEAANLAALKKYLSELEVPAEDAAEDSEDEATEEADETVEEDAEEEVAEDAEEEDAEEEEEEDADEEVKGKNKKKKSDEDEDEETEEAEAEETEDEEVSPAVVKAVKAASPADMLKRLTAFNKAAGKKNQIVFDKKTISEGYTKLTSLLVDTDGKVAKWGTAYVKDESGFCCGLEMDEVTVKPKKGETAPTRGKCKVTEVEFDFDADDSTFTEV